MCGECRTGHFGMEAMRELRRKGTRRIMNSLCDVSRFRRNSGRSRTPCSPCRRRRPALQEGAETVTAPITISDGAVSVRASQSHHETTFFLEKISPNTVFRKESILEQCIDRSSWSCRKNKHPTTQMEGSRLPATHSNCFS